jgi:hypothetical protein
VSRPPDPALARAFRTAYGAGVVLCVAWPLALQALLGTVIRPGAGPGGELALQLGYTFTGLLCAAALYIARRWHRVRAGFAGLPPGQRPRTLSREVLVYALLCAAGTLFGLAYHALGGPQADRYARGFLAMSPVMFFLFVPRLQAWRRAAREA